MEFKTVEYMTKEDKKKVYENFKRFLIALTQDIGGKEIDRYGNSIPKLFSRFTNELYNHLHLRCGFIAHYNRYTFFNEYFTNPEGIKRFIEHFVGDGFNYIYRDEYGDINTAIRELVLKYQTEISNKIRMDERKEDIAEIARIMKKHNWKKIELEELVKQERD